MASTNTVTQTTDTIERAAGIFVNALMDNKTVNSGIFQTLRARDKFALVEGSVSGIVQAYACKPTPTGTIDISDNEFTITKKSIFHEICYDIFKNTQWKDAIANLKAEGLPADFEEFLMDYVARSANADVESEMWNGNGGLTGDEADGTPSGATYIDGFGAIIRDKLTAASLTGQIVAILAANDPTDPASVQDALAQVTAALPTQLLGNPNVRMFVAPSVENAYWVSLTQQAATNMPQTDSLNYRRIPLVVIPNLNPNRIIIGIPGNMAVATAVDGDLVTVDVIDQYALGNGNFARVVGNFGYGVGVATTDFVLAEYTGL